MERLTWKDESGYYAPKNVTLNVLKKRGELVDRLAAYEDTGLEPADIEELQAKVPTWISVEERLPDLNQEVLVYAVGQIDGFFGDSVTAICKRVIFKLFPSCEGVEVWSSPWQYFHTDYKITHWMPLPAPPKGVE